MSCACAVDEREQQKIIDYLEWFGVLTTSISLYQLAYILPDHFQNAIDDLVASGVVRKSFGSGRRPVYYLAQDADRTLKELFP